MQNIRSFFYHASKFWNSLNQPLGTANQQAVQAEINSSDYSTTC